MSAIPPAAAWYRHVTEAIALRGWSKQELSDRSGVARSTIDGWQRNPRRPQAKSVNAVADVLGIDRAQALRLAGVTTPGEDGAPPSRTVLDEIFGDEGAEEFRRRVRRSRGDDADRYLAQVEEALRQQPPGTQAG